MTKPRNESMSFGMVLYFDTPVYAHGALFERLLQEQGPGQGRPLVAYADQMHLFKAGDTRVARPKKPQLAALLKAMGNSSLRAWSLATDIAKPEAQRMEFYVDCGEEEAARENAFRPWLYTIRLVVGGSVFSSEALASFTCAIADVVHPKAGVILAKSRYELAGCYLSHSAYGELSEADKQVINEMRPNQWGRCVRGPQWGTLLSPAHVETLGGLAALETHSHLFSWTGLTGGGAFVQCLASPETLETEAGQGQLAVLGRFLKPVLA